MEEKLSEFFSQTLNTAANSLSCFRLIEEFDLKTGNCKIKQNVKVFALNYLKDHFDYAALIKLFRNNIANYVFNRRKVLDYAKNDQQVLSAGEAIDKFMNITPNAIEKKNYGSGGELGEMLLYVFLEGFQKANKILSKMQLKSHANTYAHGFDGVHFYLKKYEDYSAYQLIYGEAKIENKLSTALNAALDSLQTSYSNRTTDLGLLDDSLLNEIADGEKIEFLKSIIIPKYKSADCSIETEDAFAIFLGYTFGDINVVNAKTPKEAVEERIKLDIKNIKNNLNKKINKFDLPKSSDFYIFILPFNNAMQDKHDIMCDILGVKKQCN